MVPNTLSRFTKTPRNRPVYGLFKGRKDKIIYICFILMKRIGVLTCLVFRGWEIAAEWDFKARSGKPIKSLRHLATVRKRQPTKSYTITN